jgi:hypothetical protein
MRAGHTPEQLLADRTSATAGSQTARTEATARPVGLRGEQVMTGRQDLAPFGAESARVRSCWMCGIRLPASQMMADGGSACHDVRWYCRDTWGCTRRWTSHSGRLTAIRPDISEPLETPGEHSAGLVAASPLHSASPIISLSLLGHGITYTAGMAIRGSSIYCSMASHGLVGYFRTVHPQVMCATA